MLTHQRNAVNILLFSDQTKLFRRDAVRAAPERFGQNVLLSELHRYRTDRLRGNIRNAVPRKVVDRGDILFKIARCAIRAAPHLREHQRFFHAVPRQQTAVRRTPFVKSAIKIFAVKTIRHSIITNAERIPFLIAGKQIDHAVFHVFAVRFPIFLFRNSRNRSFVTIILRLVGEKPEKLFPEILFKPRVIFFMRFADKFVRQFRV